MRDWYTLEDEADFRRAERSTGRFKRNVLFVVALLILSLCTVAQALLALR